MNNTFDPPRHLPARHMQEIAAAEAKLSEGLHQTNAALAARTPLKRYALTRGVFAIPILHDATPDESRCAEGITIDLTKVGITFELATTTRPPCAKWLLGVERDNGELGFMTVASESVTQAGLGLRISANVVTADQDPLSVENLTPTLNFRDFAFRTSLPLAVLDQWIALGVMQAHLLDRIVVCPHCHCLPTFRDGCRACGSIEVESQRMIHHFACAHVDHVNSFQHDAELACPKCRARNLVIGADFEYLEGPFQCRDCHWSDTELETIARCMNCGEEFASNEAVEKEVIGYHVDRLEPLDLIAEN